MTYKALFLDIDGTILKPDHTYTQTTKDAISQLQKQGIEVFIATGRPLHEIEELADSLGVDSYIGYNGAYALYQNETIVNEPMPKKNVEQFLEISREHNHEMVLYTNGKNYFTSLDHPFVKRFSEIFQLKKNELFQNDVMNEIIGITLLNIDSSQAALYEIDSNIRLSVVNVDGVQAAQDIIRKNVNKGEAVTTLLKRLNIPKEQAIAFGDGMNDKEMLQAVGEGFAMENSHPGLFEFAKHQTTSVSDSGIFNGLKKLGLVR